MENFLELLPIEGQTFDIVSSKWSTHVERLPIPDHSDRLCYRLKFVSDAGEERRLSFWTSYAGLHTDSSYPQRIRNLIGLWLATGDARDEICFFD